MKSAARLNVSEPHQPPVLRGNQRQSAEAATGANTLHRPITPPSRVGAGILDSRFWQRVDIRGPEECWLWKGARRNTGYGVVKRGGRQVRATQVAWALHHQTPWPAGKIACHACDTPECVNPLHIWPGTIAENNADRHQKGRTHKGGHRRTGGICRNGHPYATTNIPKRIREKGWNFCRICNDAQKRRFREKSNPSPTRSLANDTDRVPASALAARAVAEALANPSEQWRNRQPCRECEQPISLCACVWAEPEQEHFVPALNRDPERHWVGY